MVGNEGAGSRASERRVTAFALLHLAAHPLLFGLAVLITSAIVAARS
jgi:hypothetical protein